MPRCNGRAVRRSSATTASISVEEQSSIDSSCERSSLRSLPWSVFKDTSQAALFNSDKHESSQSPMTKTHRPCHAVFNSNGMCATFFNLLSSTGGLDFYLQNVQIQLSANTHTHTHTHQGVLQNPIRKPKTQCKLLAGGLGILRFGVALNLWGRIRTQVD